MSHDHRSIEAALAGAIGRPVRVVNARTLGGGDISLVERVDTDAGPFIVKSHRSAPAGFFGAEAEGLAALRRSGTSLRVPEVVAVNDSAPALIVLEDLGAGQPSQRFDEVVGRGLAELHRHRAQRFGFERDTFCGATRQPNAWAERWVDFYAYARLGHQVELARDANRLASTDVQRIEQLIAKLDTWIDEPVDGPALIHGDLWSGNLHVASTGEPALIDPSPAFAHREAELGLMRLFGGFSSRVYAAYDEAFPLDAGWRERNPLYELYHLLNHLNLFGSGYRSQVMAVVNRFV